MMNDTNNAVHVTMETYINKQYLAALAEEDAMTKQKARIKWRGDSNSAFFHASLKDKQCRENLVSIVDNSGNIVNNKSEVEHAFIEHFSELLGNKEGFIPNIDNIDPYTLPKLTSADSQSLCNEVTNEEIERAMFSLNSSSSGGPDGFNAFFYQKCWNTLQPAVCNAVRHYFKTGNMPQSYNCTNIALIPKIKNATRVADYRPISCCNTIYKCISKIIASRLKVVLPSIISKNQAAFLEGRSILDNVLLSHELLHGYGNKNTSPRAMFKLDIMKAFDMLQWDSIIRVLSYMNFPATFITWIYSCISTPMFSILLNGSPVGFFKSKQGIRQGDPLSAYLFIIIMELLTQMLNAKMEQGLFKLHPQCAEPRISSLMFADDLVIFCTPDVGTVQTIFDTLDIFYTMTGLKVNQQKSDMMTAGLSSSQVNDLCSKTGLRCSNDTLTYLGLPLCTARITTTQCMPMFARITARMNYWTSRTLSQAGRLTLIKSIVFSMQVYYARTFILPKKLLNMVRSALRKFFWKGTMESKYQAPTSFETLERPICFGGLGIMNVVNWNKAALVKHIDNFLNDGDSIWVKWSKAHVVKSRNFWTMQPPQKMSWTWRSMFKLRSCVLPYFSYRVNLSMDVKRIHG